MDPDETLAQLRAAVTASRGADDAGEHLDRIVELVDALDTWLTRGGFLPAAWRHPD